MSSIYKTYIGKKRRLVQVDMRAMKEVNINWKMLTNLRPGNKPDEIFFAQ